MTTTDESSGLILLDEQKIKAQLIEPELSLEIFDTLSSTNTYFKEHKPEKLSVCIAEAMTQGRGRLTRHWHAPYAQNLALSMFYPLQCDISQLEGLSLVVSLAAQDAISSYQLPYPAKVKWPNDLLYEQQKLAGILLEISQQNSQQRGVIIGIGINVNMLDDEGHITQAWTSLRKITGKYIDRNVLAALLINKLREYVEQFLQAGMAFFLPQWLRLDALYGKAVSVRNFNHIYTGIAEGVNAQGHLLLKLPDNSIHAFSVGDTSIIK